jgi:hypothetical protein
MKESRSALIYGALAIFSITVGPALLLMRGDSFSPNEKFYCVVSIIPLGIIALYIRYLLEKKVLMEMQDSELRQNRLQMLSHEHRQLVLIVLVTGIAASALYAWIIFLWIPSRA